MELNQLRYFLRLCLDLNITVSASKLFITQQALSKTIRQLEDELGVRLFIRGSKGVCITENGKSFQSAVQESIAILDSISTRLRMESGQQRLLLRVGVINGYIDNFSQLCSIFAKENPYLDFEISEVIDSMVEELLMNQKLDIAFVTGPVNSKNLESHFLFNTSWCMLMPESHPLSVKASLKVADISPYDIIDGTDQHNAFREFRRYCSECGVQLQYKKRTLDGITRLFLCKNGEGIALFSLVGAKKIVESEPALIYVPLDEAIKLEFYTAVPKGERLSEEAQAFLDFVIENIEEYW